MEYEYSIIGVSINEITEISDEFSIDRCAVQYNITITFKFKTPRPDDLKNSSVYRLKIKITILFGFILLLRRVP